MVLFISDHPFHRALMWPGDLLLCSTILLTIADKILDSVEGAVRIVANKFPALRE